MQALSSSSLFSSLSDITMTEDAVHRVFVSLPSETLDRGVAGASRKCFKES